jgi:hypothetical protein
MLIEVLLGDEKDVVLNVSVDYNILPLPSVHNS